MFAWSKAAKVATTVSIALATLSATGAAAGAASVMPAAARGTAAKPVAAASSPWSQTDYNAALSRANLTEQTLTAATVGNAGYLRSVASPPPPISGFCNNVPDQGVVAPSLVGGALYAMTDGRLTKYNAATGAIIWQSNPDPTFSQTYQSLAVAGGLVVVGALNCGSVSQPQGTIWAFNASNGARVWTKLVPRQGNLQSLVVSGGFVVAAGSSDGSGLIVTVRKLSTGASVWTRGGGADCSFFPLPLMVVDQVVIAPGPCATTPRIIGRNLTTGATLWQRIGTFTPLRGDSDSTTGRHVFAINPGGTVVSLDPLTGKTQYSLAGAANVLAVDGSQAYGPCGGGSNLQVCAYDSGTGSLKWQAKPEIFSEPTLAAEAGGVLYLAEGYALDTATGKTLTTLWDPFDLLATGLAVGDGRVAAVLDRRVVDLYGLPGS
jgi:outer membrane protein assembly factor BamB